MSQQNPRLDLTQLESLSPPADRLEQVLSGQLSQPETSEPIAGSTRMRTRPLLAAAACAALAAGLAWILLPLPGSVVQPAVENLAEEDVLAPWIAYSQQLEQQLKIVRPAPGVVRGHRAAAINVLREELEFIDLALTQTRLDDEALALWQARTTRLNDLLAVHTASANAQTVHGSNAQAGDPVITLQPPLAAMPAVVQL
ncbi:MAG: hypothetical protein AB8B96_20595 [Lysobacterales bacterium]